MSFTISRRSFRGSRPPTTFTGTPGSSPDTTKILRKPRQLKAGILILSTVCSSKAARNCPLLECCIILCKKRKIYYCSTDLKCSHTRYSWFITRYNEKNRTGNWYVDSINSLFKPDSSELSQLGHLYNSL